MTRQDKKDDNVPIKVSFCQKCSGWVRVSTLDYFKTNTKARNEFMKEVANYNLSVKEMPLSEWRSTDFNQCNCK